MTVQPICGRNVPGNLLGEILSAKNEVNKQLGEMPAENMKIRKEIDGILEDMAASATQP